MDNLIGRWWLLFEEQPFDAEHIMVLEFLTNGVAVLNGNQPARYCVMPHRVEIILNFGREAQIWSFNPAEQEADFKFAGIALSGLGNGSFSYSSYGALVREGSAAAEAMLHPETAGGDGELTEADLPY